jgi:hypothetical protein
MWSLISSRLAANAATGQQGVRPACQPGVRIRAGRARPSASSATLLIAASRPGRSATARGTAGKEVTVVRVDITCDLMDDPPVGGMACTDGGIWHVHRADGSPAPSGRQRLRRSLRLPQPIRFLIDIIFAHSNGLNASWIRGAKWGATADSFQATLSHCQPPSMQLDPTSGDVRPPPGTHRRCLLSSRSRVRILPGALDTIAPGQQIHGQADR